MSCRAIVHRARRGDKGHSMCLKSEAELCRPVATMKLKGSCHGPQSDFGTPWNASPSIEHNSAGALGPNRSAPVKDVSSQAQVEKIPIKKQGD